MTYDFDSERYSTIRENAPIQANMSWQFNAPKYWILDVITSFITVRCLASYARVCLGVNSTI